MKKYLVIITCLTFTMLACAQTGIGWYPSRVKIDARDSMYFRKDVVFDAPIRLNGAATGVTTLQAPNGTVSTQTLSATTGVIINDVDLAAILNDYSTSALMRGEINDSIEAHIPTTVSLTEMGYINNVTSAIQTQINAKLNKADSTGGPGHYASWDDMTDGLALKADIDDPSFTTKITTPAITLDATPITSSGTQINYLNTVTGTSTLDAKLLFNSTTDTLLTKAEARALISAVKGYSVNKIQFIVDSTTNAPNAGDSSFTQIAFIDKHLEIDRGPKGDSLFHQYRNLTAAAQIYHSGYRFNSQTGTVTFKPVFATNEHVTIEITDSTAWTDLVLDEVLSNKLIAYWSLVEAAKPLVDSVSGCNFTGSNGTPTYRQTGIVDYSVMTNADGENLYSDLAKAEILQPGTYSEYSISCWVNLNILPSIGGHLYKILTIGAATTNLWISATDVITASTTVGASNRTVTGSTVTQTGVWYHIVATFSQGTAPNKIYLNGVDVTATSSDMNANLDAAEGRVYLSYNVAGTNVDGYMCELAIFDKALSQAEIDVLYNSGNGLPLYLFP